MLDQDRQADLWCIGLRDRHRVHEFLAEPRADLAFIDERVGAIGLDHRRVAADAIGVQRQHAEAREEARQQAAEDRKSVVSGKSVSVRVDLGGRRIIKKKKKVHIAYETDQTKHKCNIKNTT